MGLSFNKIANLFFEVNDDEDGVPASIKIDSEQPKPAPLQNSYVTTPSLTTGNRNEKIRSILKETLRQKNLPGPDYIEVMDLAETLNEDLQDPIKSVAMAFKSILKTNTDGKFSKKVVEDSAKFYLDELNKEKKDFAVSIDLKFKNKVEVPKNELEKLKKDNVQYMVDIENLKKRYEKDVADLNMQIETNNRMIQTKTSQITEQITAIESSKRDFDVEISAYISEIEKNLEIVRNIK